MAILHSAMVIFLSIEETSICFAKSNCVLAFHIMKTMSPRIPANIPTTKPGRLQLYDSCVITNFSVKALRVFIAM